MSLGAECPDGTGPDGGGREAGVDHEEFLIAANIDSAKKAIEKSGVDAALGGLVGQDVGLHGVAVGVKAGDECGEEGFGAYDASGVEAAVEHGSDEAAWMALEGGELAEVGLDIEAYGGPPEMIVAGPVLEGGDAGGSLGCGVGVDVVALIGGKNDPGDGGDRGLIEFLDKGSACGGQVGKSDGDFGVEGLEGGADGGIGEEGLGLVDALIAAGEAELRSCAGALDAQSV